MHGHEKYMQRCFDLALQGLGTVAPNPLVGCVIVNDGKIIGDGYHEQFGSHHAEVNAIKSVKNKADLKTSTLYVNLEPCAHHGKTPPCADLIVEHEISQVVISNLDPFSEVDGKGISRLQSAGIKVITDILKQDGLWLNRRFFRFHRRHRPYIVLKWAQTSNGFIDYKRKPNEDRDALKITQEQANKTVHRWRSEEAAILVGTNTALLDNPNLTNRQWSGKNPLRIVIDENGKLPHSLNLFDGSTPTLVFGSTTKNRHSSIEYVEIGNRSNLVNEILQELYKRNIQSLIVEGGTDTLQQFIDLNKWDECRRFTNDMSIDSGVTAPSINGVIKESRMMGSDTLEILVPE